MLWLWEKKLELVELLITGIVGLYMISLNAKSSWVLAPQNTLELQPWLNRRTWGPRIQHFRLLHSPMLQPNFIPAYAQQMSIYNLYSLWLWPERIWNWNYEKYLKIVMVVHKVWQLCLLARWNWNALSHFVM